ncbi:hypothetical protein [Tellurirhabdus rosea]|uniref:hypothetical protein n=1 Tax=Tellurirhabdus rosea TaxID=2674997 RepID=UPI002259FC1E|nr:hypothetical protein [Tellurirhabdus rosea]
MKQMKWLVAALLCAGLNTACQSDSDSVNPDQNGLNPVDSKTLVNSEFRNSAESWSGDFADYDEQQKDIMEFSFKHDFLPAPLDRSKKALMITGHNRSDDMFMFVKRKVTGLQPNTTYRLIFEVELASQYPEDGIGIGGSPGGSVYLKAGASATEPAKVKKGTFFDFNLDKGNQAVGGRDAVLLGNVGIPGSDYSYKLIQRKNSEQGFAVTTNAQGELWLFVGTDSGFEGQTTLYYNRIKVTVL